MTQALATDLRVNDLDAALVANDTAMLHPLIFAANALEIAHGSKNLGAEQAITLRLEGPVVDGLRLLNFTVGPAADLLRRSQRDLDRVEGQRIGRFVEEV